MPSPDDRRYSESHEWHTLDGEILTIGLSKFAVDELTDVTYVEMKPAGTSVSAGDSVGEVESVKATSDVYSPFSGEIIETNSELEDDPAALNTDPYEAGWLIKIKIDDPAPFESLMTSADYDQSQGA